MNAFTPTGPTILVAAAAAAPAGVQAPATGRAAGAQFRIYNTGSVVAWVAYGPDAASATANAAIPTAGNPKNVLPVAPGSVEVITATQAPFWSALAASGVAIYITPGVGL